MRTKTSAWGYYPLVINSVFPIPLSVKLSLVLMLRDQAVDIPKKSEAKPEKVEDKPK
jgi:hypothetical protein